MNQCSTFNESKSKKNKRLDLERQLHIIISKCKSYDYIGSNRDKSNNDIAILEYETI